MAKMVLITILCWFVAGTTGGIAVGLSTQNPFIGLLVGCSISFGLCGLSYASAVASVAKANANE